jgi:hypothetical protein
VRHWPKRASLCALSCLIVATLAAQAAASTGPGTAKQVAALVAAATSITTLPADVNPSLANADADEPSSEYPAVKPCEVGVVKMPKCLFGDTTGSHTMVLFGDSHAYMWFPALDAIAKAAKWKLYMLVGLGCPVADLAVWNVPTGSPNVGCPGFRAAMIKRIDKLNPSLVVMSEAYYTLNANDQPITDAQFTTALESTFTQLHSRSMKKVLLGQTFFIPLPNECLAANTSAVQKCSEPEDNSVFAAQRASEVAATKADKVSYVNVMPWTCSSECTAVIGNMIVYWSGGHLTTVYATYLTNVLHASIKSLMR